MRKITTRICRRSFADPQVCFGYSEFEKGFMTTWINDVKIATPETMFDKILEDEFLLKRGPILSKDWSKDLEREWKRGTGRRKTRSDLRTAGSGHRSLGLSMMTE